MMQKLIDLDEDERRLIGPYLVVDHPSGNEYRGFCAECEDPDMSKSPSASYNFIRGEWHCMKNDCGGTINRLMEKLTLREKNASSDDADIIDIKTKRKTPDKPLPTKKQIDGFVLVLRQNKHLLQSLSEKRGVDIATLDRFQIGYDNTQKRFTIPVYAANRELLNVRKYNAAPKSATVAKMLPWATGYGTSLFNEQALDDNDEIVLCEGEWDCIISEQHGIPTVTTTGGVSAFQVRWAAKFKDKHVFICFDEDEPGIKGATRTARLLQNMAAGVYIVTGLSTGKKDGDLTDFYLNGGSADQFRALMDKARETPFAKDTSNRIIPTEGKTVSLEESQSPHYDEPLQLEVLIAGKVTPPFCPPKRIHARCEQNQGKKCALCPMAAYDGDRTMDTDPDDIRLLKFIESSEKNNRNNMKELFGAACTLVDYDVTKAWSMEELIVVQSLDYHNEETMTPITRKVYNVGTYKSTTNTTAKIVGRQVPDPRSNRGIFHSWHLEPTASNIDQFEIDESDRRELEVFQTEFGQTPLEKCKEIAEDLEANVTRIYGRSMLHVAYDIVWHSVIDFQFMGKKMDKGWLDALVIGDTRTGKSETAKLLCEHYNAGNMTSCEGATFAGLVGGNQIVANKAWQLTWGVIPLNDRRLVVLDEVSGLVGGREKQIIEQMSTVRSSGKASLTKIESGETSARTRLLWISNPVDGRTIAETPGVSMEAIGLLVKNPEDIARFDFALGASQRDVPSSLINSMKHKHIDHVFDSKICSKLVLWAWSRKSEQVIFRKGAEEAIIAASEDLGSRYVSDFPLIQSANVRMKLARIAVAIAARTFSTNKACDEVWVLPVHVSAAVEFLDWIYKDPAMGYDEYSAKIVNDNKLADLSMPVFKEYCLKNPPLLEFMRTVRENKDFRPQTFKDLGAEDEGITAYVTIPLLLKWKMIKRGQQGVLVLSRQCREALKEIDVEDI